MQRLLLGAAAALALSTPALAQSASAAAIAERCIEQGGPAETCQCAAREMDARLDDGQIAFILAVSEGEPGDPEIFAEAMTASGYTMEDVAALQAAMVAAQPEIAEACGLDDAAPAE